MTRIEELAPTSKPASFGLAHLISQRPGVFHHRQKQREVSAVLVRILGDVNRPRLDQGRSKHRRTGKLDLSAVEQHRDPSAALESLRPASHSDRSTGRDGEQGSSRPGTIRGEYVDDGVTAPESMGLPVGRRWVELVPRRPDVVGGFSVARGFGTDAPSSVNISAASGRSAGYVRTSREHPSALRLQLPNPSESRRELSRRSPEPEPRLGGFGSGLVSHLCRPVSF